MRRLLWKEFKERRVWAVLWAASMPGVAILARAGFCGTVDALSAWFALPFLLSLLVGAGAYSSELTGERATFAYSRPISWKKMLLAKSLFGITIAVGSCVLAAVGYRLFCPPQYLPFATFSRLAQGVGTMSLFMCSAYLGGLLCSVVLPGVSGGILVAIASLLLWSGIEAVVVGSRTRSEDSIDMLMNWLTYGQVLGTVAAATVVMRFGLTLSTRARVVRFSIVVLTALLSASILAVTIPNDWTARSFVRKDYQWSSVSPSGKYAFAFASIGTLLPGLDYDGSNYLVRLSDGKSWKMDLRGMGARYDTLEEYGQGVGTGWESIPIWYWTSSDTLLFYHDPFRPASGICTVTVGPDDRLILQSVRVGSGNPRLVPSPDGRYLMVVSPSFSKGGGPTRLEFVDVEAARKIGPTIEGARSWWWQSDHEVGYTDREGNRHILRVGD